MLNTSPESAPSFSVSGPSAPSVFCLDEPGDQSGPSEPMLGRRATIDPREHLGLVFVEAARAARRYDGLVEDFLGEAYLAAHDAARTFTPGGRSSYAGHACRHIRWKCRDRCLLPDKGMRKGCQNRRTRPMPITPREYLREAAYLNRSSRLGAHHHGGHGGESDAIERLIPLLSPQQRAVVELVARGMSRPAIAAALGISTTTIKEALCRVRRKARAAGLENAA